MCFFKKLCFNSRYFSTFSHSIDESNISKEILEVQTIKQFKSFAKKHEINLRGFRVKEKIVNIILAHFLHIKASTTPVEVLNKTFNIVTNDDGYINVSL
jgi:hypothetical protein